MFSISIKVFRLCSCFYLLLLPYLRGVHLDFDFIDNFTCLCSSKQLTEDLNRGKIMFSISIRYSGCVSIFIFRY